MKDKYIKKQIIESIRYWQNVLKKINESENQLMQALSNAFGKDKLFSRNFKDRFNEDFFNKCYNIFNKYLFFSKLDKIHIFYQY